MTLPNTFFDFLPTWLGVYGLTSIMLAISALLFYKRVVYHILNSNHKLDYSNINQRIKNVIINGLGQKKVLKRTSITKDRSGIGHVVIFISFLSYSISYLIFIYGDSINEDFSNFLLGSFLKKIYLNYLEIVAIFVFIAIISALIRRWILTPTRLKFKLTKKPESAIILLLILALMSTHLLSETMNQAMNVRDGFYVVSTNLSKLFIDSDMNKNNYIFIHDLFWWLHLMIILSFAVYIPLSKHLHLLVSPLSFFFGTQSNSGGIIDTPNNLEEMEVFGANNIQSFKPKQIMDFFACAVCGRCSEVCPTNLTEKQLSPMYLVNNLMNSTTANYKDKNIGVIDENISKTEIWDCLNCGACVNECPVGIDHISPIIDMRRHLVMEKSEMPETAESTLLSLEQRGHPWRGTTFTRSDWHQNLDVKTISENPNAEYLLWIGCTGALVERNQNVSQSIIKILNSAKIDYAILSNEETCTGDPAKRIGNEYLFQILANQNIQNFIKYDIKKIITHCPHCLNTIKNEYPSLGFNAEVISYTEIINELINSESIIPIKENTKSVAYHDPCFLGRHNSIYEQPRDIVDSIPGLKRMEMCRNKDKALCCGAGGGHMWIEESNEKRVSHLRTDDFLETDSETLAVACPFCLQMFEEGLSAKTESKKEVKDIAELLEESLEKED